jgi:hypothetical protein
MDRPECNQTPPDLTQSKEILKYLLEIEIVRLKTAVRIEKERNIVFPETTIIIRDIQKLANAINGESDKKELDVTNELLWNIP